MASLFSSVLLFGAVSPAMVLADELDTLPIESTEPPIDSEELIEPPVEPTEPPSEPEEPIEPPVEPTEPPSEPEEPIEPPVEPTEPPIEPEEPIKPPVEPTEPPVETEKPIEPPVVPTTPPADLEESSELPVEQLPQAQKETSQPTKKTNTDENMLNEKNESLGSYAKVANNETRKEASIEKQEVVNVAQPVKTQLRQNVAIGAVWLANAPEDINIKKGDTSYVIQWGDTLWAIAIKADTTIETLAKLNSITNVDLIYAGDTLRLV